MDLKILGSGATHPIPKPCCGCDVCEEAREEMSPPNMRTGPALYIEDIEALIDTSQDISFQLNRERIKDVRRIFYTHFHPDHTMGMMVINQLAGSYDASDDSVEVLFPDGVLEDLRDMNMSGMMDYYIERGIAEAEQDFKSRKFDGVKIEAVPLEESNTYGYSLEDERKIFYAPCDLTEFDLKQVSEHEIFILEFGGLEMEKFEKPDEITDFHRLFGQLKQIGPDRVVFTHIEENRGMNHEELKEFASDLEKEASFEIDIAFDGMEI
ncbi:MAG: MBL fold metallo-hydrolase [Candidatus Nanohalobium sp.]